MLKPKNPMATAVADPARLRAALVALDAIAADPRHPLAADLVRRAHAAA